MGDAIEENIWDGENEIDLAQNYRSDEEFEEASGSDDEVAQPVVDEKTSKKRKKFEALKLKKKQKLLENDVAEKNSKSTLKALSVEEMIYEIESNRPRDPKFAGVEDLSPADFCYAELDESTTTKSEKNKKICPFVRALSANMPGYKKALVETKVTSKEDFGSPVLLILCSSAIRATQIIKSISAKLIKCKIAKLFAKHFKVEEQMEMLSNEYYPIALGTPNRVRKLIELGALSLKRTAIVLVDVTVDSKQFSILTMNEVKNDFYRLLYDSILPEKAHLKISLINKE